MFKSFQKRPPDNQLLATKNHELYQKILRQILHPVGECNTGLEVCEQAMLSYIQDTFKISNDDHRRLLLEAEAMGPSQLLLNVELLEAKELVPKYAQRLSNPFVTVYMTSNPRRKCDTSVKHRTVNPVWEECLSLPLPLNYQDHSLCLEVWDRYDDDVTIGKGLQSVKEIIKKKRLIGTANISLKSIPPSGQTMSFNLIKKAKRGWQGELTAKLNISGIKSQSTLQDHRDLLRALLVYELQNTEAPYWPSWISGPARAILTQDVVQSGLSATDHALAQWSVYCAITAGHPINFAVFNKLLAEVIEPLQSGLVKDEDAALFWDGATIILPICFEQISKLRETADIMTNPVHRCNLREVLKILDTFSKLKVPNSVDLFSINTNSSMRDNEDGSLWTNPVGMRKAMDEALKQAVTQGAMDWFEKIWPNNKCESDMDRVKHIIDAIQLVNSDLEQAIQHYDTIFKEIMNFAYTTALYELYDDKITLLAESDIRRIDKRLKQSIYSQRTAIGVSIGDPSAENELLANTCSKLYLTFQTFYKYGQRLNKSHWSSYAAAKFLPIFLNIDAYMAITFIKKAVERDDLTDTCDKKMSMSVVDTKIFLIDLVLKSTQFTWPDTKDAHSFTTEIVHVIRRCCVSYSDQMASRVSSAIQQTGDVFIVPGGCCVAANNVEDLWTAMDDLFAKLRLQHIQELYERVAVKEEDEEDTSSCQDPLPSIAEKSKNVIKYRILEILRMPLEKMMPRVIQFLQELHLQEKSQEVVMKYLDDNLKIMHGHLSDENLLRTFDVLWELLEKVFYDVINDNLEKRTSPAFFSKLYVCFKQMTHSWCETGSESYSSNSLVQLEKMLKLYAMESEKLIHQYHLERSQQEIAASDFKIGILTVRAPFIVNKLLKLEVLSCTDLKSSDSTDPCDSFVRVELLPKEMFKDVPKLKTKKPGRSCFPLYDEQFVIPLNDEQRRLKDGLIHFNVMDQDLFGVKFVGEAYLKLSEVPQTSEPLQAQLKLTLTKPQGIDKDMMKVLKLRSRQGDKGAAKILKMLPQ